MTVPIRYRIICANSILELESAVSACMADGWEPHGTPCTFDGAYSQAVILPDNKFPPVAETPRCPKCHGTGMKDALEYCECPMGVDLRRIESR
jgi:hypothetical protein